MRAISRSVLTGLECSAPASAIGAIRHVRMVSQTNGTGTNGNRIVRNSLRNHNKGTATSARVHKFDSPNVRIAPVVKFQVRECNGGLLYSSILPFPQRLKRTESRLYEFRDGEHQSVDQVNEAWNHYENSEFFVHRRNSSSNMTPPPRWEGIHRGGGCELPDVLHHRGVTVASG